MRKKEAKIEALTMVASFAAAHADDMRSEGAEKVANELLNIADSLRRRVNKLMEKSCHV